MKKVLYLLVTLLFTLTLVSCKKGKQITLSYDKNEIEIFVGEEVNVKPNVEVGKKVKNYELNYELSENIATIKDGKLTAKEKGTVVVTVTTDQDKDAVASLKVVIKEKEIIPTEYKITLDADGGIVEKTEIKFIENEKVTLPIPSKEGYIFKGWYEDGVLVETLENRNYTLKAEWEKEDTGEYTIIYRFIEGDWDKSDPNLEIRYEYKAGDTFKLVPLIHPSDLIFVGWYDNPEFNGEPITEILPTDRGDKVLYPKWREEYIPEKIETIDKITLDYNESYQLEWNIYPEDSSKKVKFESNDSSIASVDDNGLITGLKYGKTIVKIISLKDENIYAKIEVTVSGDKASELIVEKNSIDLNLGDTYELNYSIFPLTAYQGIEVIINDSGLECNNNTILAKKIGVYTITLKTIDDTNLSVDIRISVNGGDEPVFSFGKGYKENLTISWNEEFDLLKDIRAFDSLDGEITDNIKVSGDIDNRRYGEYVIEYYIENSKGDFTTLTRTINVIWDYNVTVIGHAGSYYGVPNSEEAILYAAEVLKYPAIEIDLKQTKDGVFVLSHDPVWGDVVLEETNYDDLKDVEYTVTKTAGIVGSSLSNEERTYTAKICTFERYLEICKEYNIIAVVELKTSAGISNWTESNTPEKSRMPAMMELIKKHDMLNRVIFLSSQELCLNWVKTNGYEYIPCQYLTLKSCANIDTYNIIKKYKFDISFNVRDGIKINDDWINAYKKLGVKLAVFTFEEYATYDEIQYWIDRGVDYVTTDWHELDKLELSKNE